MTTSIPSQSEPASRRRPMRWRESLLIRKLAGWLHQRGVAPNTVSLASAVFSAFAGACLVGSGRVGTAGGITLLLVAPVFVGFRALCNLLDGLIAIEGGQRTKSGEVFNDAPDRVSDLLIFCGAGYGALEQPLGLTLGWIAAAFAILTAYVRMLGGALGTPQFFTGPMAKPHRMGVLCAACVAAGVERAVAGSTWGLVAGLAIIAAGGLLTSWVRLRKVVAALEKS